MARAHQSSMSLGPAEGAGSGSQKEHMPLTLKELMAWCRPEGDHHRTLATTPMPPFTRWVGVKGRREKPGPGGPGEAGRDGEDPGGGKGWREQW